MITRPIVVIGPALLNLLLSSIAYESAYAQIPTRQFAKVEVSEFIGGSGPTSVTSDAIDSLDLVAGIATGLQAALMTTIAHTEAPVQGVSGILFVQANSLDVSESSASALFEYEFLLPQETVLTLLLRFTSRVDEGAAASFLLERDGSPIFSSSGESLLIKEDNLAPGLYNLTVEASAFASDTVAIEFNSAQVDFALFVKIVPEPGTATLASILLLTLFARSNRRV